MKKGKTQQIQKSILYIISALIAIFVVAKYVFGIPLDFLPNKTAPENALFSSGDTFQVCDRNYEPVCGSNGVTYINKCLAERDSIMTYAVGVCPKTSTGLTDQGAVHNFSCDKEDEPVCGKDGKTYKNVCLAAAASVAIVSYGSCESEDSLVENLQKNESDISPESTGALLSPDIIEAIEKAENDESIPQDIACTADYKPVCGKDGKTYGNECSAQVAGVEIANPGECLPSSEATSSVMDPKKTITYTSKAHSYSFAMPNYSHYQAYGAQAGASHTMAISVDQSGISDFANADVKVYVYKSIPANPPAGSPVMLENGGIAYISLSNSSNTKLKTIADTIIATIK